MFHPSLLFLHGHFETTFQSTILPYFPVLKAQDVRNSAHASRSLATWPSQMQTQFMSPKSSTRSLLWTITRCLLTIQTSNEISDFLKNTHENTGLSDVLTMFESSVCTFLIGDFVPQRESKESMQSGNRCLDREKQKRERVL